MPRKTAAQKAKAAASSSSTNEPELLQHGPHIADDQPRRKKSKTSHSSMTDENESLPKPEKTTTQDETNSKATGRQPGHTRPAPPPVPSSVASSTVILPREADDLMLRAMHEIHGINITPNAKMEPKIQQVLAALRALETDGTPTIVALTAPARAANKCIGVAEIAVRELVKGRKVFQYTGCWTRLETHEPPRNVWEITLPEHEELHDRRGNPDEEAPEAADDSDEAFEENGMAERKKVRDNVCLVIYLSFLSVAQLHDLYGEQVHAMDKG